MNKKKTLLLALTLAAIPFSYKKAADRKFEKLFKVERSDSIYKNKPKDISEDLFKANLLSNLNWLKTKKHQEVEVSAYDGTMLKGLYIKGNDSHKTVILLHGASQDRLGVLNQARIFDRLGYDLLLIDQRGHGKSEGIYTTYGYKEAIDLARWITYLNSADNSIEIGLYGISLGANAIMLYLGHKVKDNIEFAIVESGFVNAYENLSRHFVDKLLYSQIRERFKRAVGFDLAEIDCESALRENSVPIMLLHSEFDEVVEVSDARRLFEANKGEKYLHIFDNSTHLSNCYAEDYAKVFENFISILK